MFWLILGLISSFAFGTQDTINYYVTNKLKYSGTSLTVVIHLFYTIIGFLGLFIISFFNNKYAKRVFNDLKNIIIKNPIFAILAGIFGFAGNALVFQAYKIAPPTLNPAIITGIGNVSIIFSTLFAYFFYNKSINVKQGIGIFILGFALFLFGFKNFDDIENLFITKKKDDKFPTKFTTSKSPKSTGPLFTKQWFILALLSSIAYGGLAFFDYVLLQKNKNATGLSIAISLGIMQTIIGFLPYFLFKLDMFKSFQTGFYKNYNENVDNLLTPKVLPYSISSAFLDILGLATVILGYKGAPNPGFSDSVSNTYLIPQAFLTNLLFKTPLKPIQFGSIILAIGGITLLSI